MKESMEKFLLPKKAPEKIKNKARITNIIGGLSLGSVVATSVGVVADMYKEAANPDNFSKNDIELQNEWDRNDLESNKEINKNIARAFAIEEIKEDLIFWKESFSCLKEENLKLKKELEYRKNHKESSGFKTFTMEDILSLVKNNEDFMDFCLAEIKLIQEGKSKNLNEEKLTELEQNKLEEIKKVISFYDIGRQWVLNNIEDPKYQERLEKEFFDEDKTNKDLASFIKKNYENRTKEAFDKNFILSKDVVKSYKSIEGEDAYLGVDAFYNTGNKKTYFSLENDSIQAVTLALHEYAHKVTEANRNLSPKAIKLFSEAFDTLSVAANFEIKNSQDSLEIFNYLSNPTEIYARKKVFEYDLEKLGVKKYGDEFTREHLMKAIILLRNGKLLKDSQEFLLIIKPEMLIKVMNEIADVNENKKQDLNSA